MKIFDKMKMKAKAIALQPKIVKRLGKYQGIAQPELKEMMVQKLSALMMHEKHGSMTDEFLDEFMIDQAAICTMYFMATGTIPNQDQMNSFMHACGMEAGMSEEQLALMTA